MDTNAPLTLGEKLLIAAALFFVALKLVYTLLAFPIADEAYYWLWGRHLALSYFDHPPLGGWVQGAVYSVLGRSLFALRLPALLAFVAIIWVLWASAQRIGGERPRLVFLKSLVVYLASPLFGGFFGAVVFHDYLLVALLMAAGYFFICYFADVEETGGGRLRDLLLAALLLGLAGLTKYNAVFLGLAVAGTVLVRPRLWPLLGRWPIYAAGLLAVAMQAPVLIWNWQHGFASFAFHTGGRFPDSFHGLNVAGMKAFAVDTASLLSWFLVPVIVSFFLRQPREPFMAAGKTLAIWTFWLSSAVFLYISNYNWVVWWWNIAAFVLVFPFAGRIIGPITLSLHVLWGAVLSSVLVVTLAIAPVTLIMGGGTLMEAETEYGWPEVAAAVRAERTTQGAAFVAANRYQAASKLAFALDDPDVASLSPRRDGFDDWWYPSRYEGQDAIVVVDGRDEFTWWQTQFASAEKLRDVNVEMYGKLIYTYEIWLGRGFRPTPDPSPSELAALVP